MNDRIAFVLLLSVLLCACAWTPVEQDRRARTEAMNEFWGRV